MTKQTLKYFILHSITMQTITIKIDDSIAKKINSYSKKFHYSTKTEFIRDAIRDKLIKLQKEEVLDKYQLQIKKQKKNYKPSKDVFREIGLE